MPPGLETYPDLIDAFDDEELDEGRSQSSSVLDEDETPNTTLSSVLSAPKVVILYTTNDHAKQFRRRQFSNMARGQSVEDTDRRRAKA